MILIYRPENYPFIPSLGRGPALYHLSFAAPVLPRARLLSRDLLSARAQLSPESSISKTWTSSSTVVSISSWVLSFAKSFL